MCFMTVTLLTRISMSSGEGGDQSYTDRPHVRFLSECLRLPMNLAISFSHLLLVY